MRTSLSIVVAGVIAGSASGAVPDAGTIGSQSVDSSVQMLSVPEGQPEVFDVRVRIDGVEQDVHLERHSVRSESCIARVWTGEGYEDWPVPEPRTYRGHLTDDPSVAVVGALTDAGLSATVHFAPRLAVRIEPLGGGRHAVGWFEPNWDAAEGCGVTEGAWIDAAEPAQAAGGEGGQSTCVIKLAQLAFDADYEFYSAYGSVDDTIARIDQIMNDVNYFYARDVLIEHVIPAYVVRTAPFYFPTGGGDLLELFRAEWINNQSHITRDIAHLMTGKPGSLIEYGGLAWVGVVCNVSYGYAWSMDSANIVGHEVGHSWAAGHCHDTTPCNNMCGGCFYIAPITKTIIEAHRDSRTCLDDSGPFATPVPPYAHPDTATMRKSDLAPITLDVLGNDHDANCDPVGIGAFDATTARGATVTLSVGTGPDGRDELLYTPPATPFVGVDTFSYTAIDGTGQFADGTVSVEIRAEQLIGYWKLDDGSGTTARDATPGGRDGTLHGDAAWAEGRYDGALSLDGSGDSVSIPALAAGSDEATITAWIRRDGEQPDYAGLVFQREGTWATGLNLGTHNELRYHWNGAASSYTWDSGLEVPDGQWVFVALSVSPDRALMYLYDTTLRRAWNTAEHAWSPLDRTLYLGIDRASTSRYFRGEMDDVRFYDYALSTDEIRTLAERGGRARAPSPADGAKVYDPARSLTWVGGLLADSHDVYTGPDYAQVRDATRGSAEYRGNQALTEYTPASPLRWGRSTYWRIDEVLGADVIPGEVWQLRTADAWRWPLNETQGTTAAETILGFDGMYRDGVTLGEPGARPWTGRSVYLSSDIDRVELPPVNLYDNHATITAWIKRSGRQVAYSGIVFSRFGDTVAGINLRSSTSDLGYHWNNDAATYDWVSNLSVPDGEWVLVGLVVEPDKATMYLGHGGVLMSAVNAIDHGIEEFNGITHVGRDTAGRVFRGWVDDVRFYNAALSFLDIDAIYRGRDWCRADFNGDGLVDSQDFIAFLNAFGAGDPAADFNGDGVVDSQDFIAFLNAFVAGC